MIPVPVDMTPAYRRKRISEIIRSIDCRRIAARDGWERFCRMPAMALLERELLELIMSQPCRVQRK